MFFFFFSSRRRHTRFDCDWSSDVCSSDLAAGSGAGVAECSEGAAEISRNHDGASTADRAVSDGGEVRRDAGTPREPLCGALGAGKSREKREGAEGKEGQESQQIAGLGHVWICAYWSID